MKSGTVEHPKFRMLRAVLQQPDYVIVGILESLWNVTAKWKDHGGIGEWTNVRICSAIDWRGDPNELIEALVKTGWLDDSEQYRLVIHDWEDHCPEYVHDRLRKRGEGRPKRRKKKESPTTSENFRDVPQNSETSSLTQPNPTQPSIPPAAEKHNETAEGTDAADNTASDVTFDEPTRAAIAAFDRWSEQFRRHPLRKHQNEHRPIIEFLRGLPDRPPIVRADSTQVCQLAYVPQAVDLLAVQKATKFTSSKYAVKCVETLLEEWARDGPPGGKSKATPTKEWKSKPYCPG